MLQRELKRKKAVEKYKGIREDLVLRIKSSQDPQERAECQLKLALLPVNSSPVRQVSRCQQCGRAHAVYAKFGLCRICLRQELMVGNVPGGRKSSW